MIARISLHHWVSYAIVMSKSQWNIQSILPKIMKTTWGWWKSPKYCKKEGNIIGSLRTKRYLAKQGIMSSGIWYIPETEQGNMWVDTMSMNEHKNRSKHRRKIGVVFSEQILITKIFYKRTKSTHALNRSVMWIVKEYENMSRLWWPRISTLAWNHASMNAHFFLASIAPYID